MADHPETLDTSRRPERLPGATKRTLVSVGVVGAVLLFADVFIEKHSPFAIEHTIGFYALAGFAGVLVMMAGARLVSALLSKGETYYDA